MRKLKISRIFALLLVFALVFLIPFTASADNGADKKGTVNVVFFHENIPITGAAFHIYKVAELQGSDYELVGDFANYRIYLGDISDVDNLSALTTTLSAYIARDSIAPYAEGQTNETGGMRLEGLEDGLYIGVGDRVKIDDTTYIPLPFMFEIPGKGTDGQLIYDVVVEPKYDLYTAGVHPATVDRRVLKIWDDNDDKSGKRTPEIAVQLLQDGKVYDEIILNESNGWHCSWDKLPAEYQWLTIEKDVSEDYLLSMTQQGITFTLTNIYDGDEPEDPNDPGKPSDPSLPQTGQLWWPVPVLLIAGIAICFMGIVLKKRSESPNA